LVSIPVPSDTVQIIRFRAYRRWHQPMSGKLYRQTVAERGLSRRRRTGDHDKFYASSLCNLSRQFRDFLLLQRFGNQHHPMRTALADLVVQSPDGIDAQSAAPVFRFLLYLEHFPGKYQFRQFFRLPSRREHQYKSCIVQLKDEILQVSCIRRYESVKIILKAIQLIEIYTGYSAVTEQLFLFLHTIPAEFFSVFLRSDTFFHKRKL